MTTRLRTSFDHLLCALRGGHAWALYLSPGRLYLHCVLCQRETRGWEISTASVPLRQRLTATGDRLGRIMRFRRRA